MRSHPPLHVLFVCTANISRSPYAERRAVQLLGAPPPPEAALRVSSAGVPGFPGREMDPEMGARLRERGADHLGHVSRSVSAQILADVDVVVTMEYAHRMRIATSWPEHAPKVFGLQQLTDALERVPTSASGRAALEGALALARPDSLSWDVADPYRRGRKAARAAAAEIDEALAVIVGRLAGIPAVLGN
ncbi:protein tyrosine phosphatase [Knoellia sp. Soil729]|nr:protein tyrosine phosphatase [Knoellia sp. Soil729]